MEPLQNEFGWSRAEASVGLTIVGMAAAVAALPIGLMVDRLGPRRAGLTGVTLMAAAFALLGSATESVTFYKLLIAAGLFAGGLFGGLVAALSLGTAFGPLAAGATSDHFGGYSNFLILTMILMGASSLALASLKAPPDWTMDAQPAVAAGTEPEP